MSTGTSTLTARWSACCSRRIPPPWYSSTRPGKRSPPIISTNAVGRPARRAIHCEASGRAAPGRRAQLAVQLGLGCRVVPFADRPPVT